MIKLTPILLILLYAAAMWFFSLWRLKAELNAKSAPLTHPRLVPMLERLGRAMGLPPIRAHVYEIAPVNGLAAPDGRIFLTRGFLDRLDRNEVTEAELASVPLALKRWAVWPYRICHVWAVATVIWAVWFNW